MGYKKTMPRDMRELCCAYARGYRRRCEELTARRNGIYSQGKPQKGTAQLECVDSSFDRQAIIAVENALIIACVGIRSREVCRCLQDGIILNICNRKKHPYERLRLPAIGRNEFYRRKNDFLFALAQEIEER